MTDRNALQRLAYVYGWRVRHLWLDTNAGRWLCLGLAAVLLVATGVVLGWGITRPPAPHPERVLGLVWWVHVIWMVVTTLIMMALAPKPKKPEAGTPEVPTVEDGKGIRMVFGGVGV